MKKLTFFRSYQGSFSLAKEDSLFSLRGQKQLQLPVTVELGFSAPIDPDSGMSASLPLMNQLWAQAQDKLEQQNFSSVLDLYGFLNSFFKAHATEFSVLKLLFQDFQFWNEGVGWYFYFDSEKVFQIKELSSAAFISLSQWQFYFSTMQEFQTFLKQDFQNLRIKLRVQEFCEKPFDMHDNLKAVALRLPTVDSIITLEKPL